MPLHTDYRPNTLEDFIGNRTVKSSITNLLKKDNPPHTYLLTGPSGCGKTTLARILANQLNCEGFNLKEINCSNQRKLEDARDIINKTRMKGLGGGNKGWILDEFHLFGEGGNSSKNKPQNSLLKVLEEPPQHCYFFLCSTDPQMILSTIRSRCTELEVEKLTSKSCKQLLSSTCKKIGADVPDDVLNQIAKNSDGMPRQALTILEKIVDLPERQMLRAAKQELNVESKSIDLCKALIARNSWGKVSKILKGLNEDPETIRRNVLGYASSVLLNGKESAYLIMDAFREPFYNTGKPGLILACYEALEVDDG